MSFGGSKTQVHLERFLPGTEHWRQGYADHVSRYLRAAEFVRGRNVLDAGTGPGYGAAMLKLAGALSVQAIDIDAATIERARQAYPIDGLTFMVDDCETLANVQAPVEVICSFENIEHLQRPERFLEAAARLLPDDGLLLCSTPDRAAPYAKWVDGRPNNPFHLNEWYRDEFKDLLYIYFKRLELLSQVVTHAFSMRKRAVENLNRQLTYLWSSPLLRLARAAGRLAGRRREWPTVTELGVASPADYSIVPYQVADEFGEPWCHYVICREPKR